MYSLSIVVELLVPFTVREIFLPHGIFYPLNFLLMLILNCSKLTKKSYEVKVFSSKISKLKHTESAAHFLDDFLKFVKPSQLCLM